jgi:hypothetical protein
VPNKLVEAMWRPKKEGQLHITVKSNIIADHLILCRGRFDRGQLVVFCDYLELFYKKEYDRILKTYEDLFYLSKHPVMRNEKFNVLNLKIDLDVDFRGVWLEWMKKRIKDIS